MRLSRALAPPFVVRRLRAPGDQRALIGWGLAALIALLVLPPMWFLASGSLHLTTAKFGQGAFTLRYYARIIDDPRLLESVVNSCLFAVGSAVIALVSGAMLAWIVERTNAPCKTLAWLTTIISLGTPYVLYVTAWLLLLGRAGPVNDLWRQATGDSGVLLNVYSVWGMTLVEGCLWSPFAFLLLSSTFRVGNPEFEEAARISGASVWDTIRRVTLPLALPSLAALAMLVFIRAIEAFEVPALVGLPGRVNVMTTDIYLDLTDRMPPDFGNASAFSAVLLVVVAILLFFYNRLSRRADRFHTITGKGYRQRPFDLGRGRWIAGGVLILNFLVILVLPTLMLVWTSLMPFFQTIKLSAFRLLTLQNYATVFGAGHYLGLVENTLFAAAAAATLVMAFTAVAAWLTVRRYRGAWVLDQVATMPLIYPGIVLGVAIMQIFLAVPLPIYGTIWIIVIAFLIGYMPYGMRYAYVGMLQIHHELEEAAGVAGATPLQAFRRVVVPLLAPAVVSGWLFVFLLGARVLSVPILLAGPDSQMVAVAMYDLWTNGQGTELAAFGLVWTALMTVIASGFYVIGRRSGAGAFGR